MILPAGRSGPRGRTLGTAGFLTISGVSLLMFTSVPAFFSGATISLFSVAKKLCSMLSTFHAR